MRILLAYIVLLSSVMWFLLLAAILAPIVRDGKPTTRPAKRRQLRLALVFFVNGFLMAAGSFIQSASGRIDVFGMVVNVFVACVHAYCARIAWRELRKYDDDDDSERTFGKAKIAWRKFAQSPIRMPSLLPSPLGAPA